MSPFVYIVVTSSVLAGVVGGVFFAFSVFVMRALAQLEPGAGIAAMQQINVTVINPLFLGTFLCTAPLLALSAYLAHAGGHTNSLAWLVAAFLACALGAVGVTITFNVPRNNKLAGLPPTSEGAAIYWPIYVRQWLLWNHVRCIAALVASSTAVIAVSAANAA